MGVLGPIGAAVSLAQPDYAVTINVGNYLPPEPYLIDGQAVTPIENFRYLVNVDNSGDPSDPDPLNHPGVHAMASNSPIVEEGWVSGDTVTLSLPEGRYLVTIQANVPEEDTDPGAHHTSSTHKMWGVHVDLPADANTTKQVDLIPFPLPLGKLVVYAFPDNAPVNGAPDPAEIGAEAGLSIGLEGFNVIIEDVSGGIVTQNFLGDPICTQYDTNGDPIPDTGGECFTGPDGVATIDNLAPGKYEIYMLPPDGSGYIQTSTFEGGFPIDHSVVTEGDDGLGAIREAQLATLTQPTAYWFGFVQEMEIAPPGPGSISGCAAHWQAFPPFDTPVINKNEPIENGFVALSDIGNDQQVYAARLGDSPDCPGGVIDIQGVQPGAYNMFVWDEQLTRIFRIVKVVVPVADPVVDVGDVGVFRWFGWVSGHVFDDGGIAKDGTVLPNGTARNGIRDCVDPNNPTPATCESGLVGQDLDIRARDGSVLSATFTDSDGYYEYPQEISKLFKFRIGEVGFGRWGTSGPCVYNENPQSPAYQYDPTAQCVLLDSALGGGLLTNQLTVEGHRSTVDWGKYVYGPASGGPEGEVGQITGIVFYATTRNELDPRFASAEDYEPGIPEVPVHLIWTGDDQLPNTPDDVLVDDYGDGAGTDLWEHPTAANQGVNGMCDVHDSAGDPVVPDPVTHFGASVADNCFEFPVLNNETKDGAFDGGFAFAEMCDPAVGYPCDPADRIPLLPGDYIVEVTSQEADASFPYEIVKEEDINVDQGDDLVPAITPWPCVGEDHLVVDERSPYDGQMRPLCNERLVTLEGQANPGADFFLFTDTPIPSRAFGLVTDDINVETNPESPSYGEPRPLANVPIGIRDYSYRLLTTITTDEYGYYETLLPSSQTAYCPTPAGTCPGTYVFVINDPGDPGNPNPNFNPNYITEPLSFEFMPGKMRPLDTPLDPISGVACSDYAGPEFFAVDTTNGPGDPDSGVVIRTTATGTLRNVTIRGLGFGASRINPNFPDERGMITLVHPDGTRRPLDDDSYYVSWSDEAIVFTFPTTTLVDPPGAQGTTVPPAPYQILVTAPRPDPPTPLPPELFGDPSKSLTAPTGITLHYLGTNVAGMTYNFTSAQIQFVDWLNGSDSNNGNLATPHKTIQDAINDEAAGALIIVMPATYQENVILWKRLKLQGFGPGGINGTRVLPEPPEDEVRRQVFGTVINASFFNSNSVLHNSWQALMNGLPATFFPGGPLGSPSLVDAPAGAGITIVGAATTYASGNNRSIVDGFGIHSARPDAVFSSGGGGGIYLNGNARFLQLSNNFVEGNQGVTGGGIILGQPYRGPSGNTSNNNTNVLVAYNRILGNGGTQFAGGIGIYNGANAYSVLHNDICANFSAEYGGGLSHYGRSDGANTIAQNRFYFNDAFDEGGGVMIGAQVPLMGVNPNGTGNVSVERNVFSSNQSGDDGGGIKISDAVQINANGSVSATQHRINVTNNMFTNNNAADLGGGIALDDSTNVWIVHNTIAKNTSTASCEGCVGQGPHAAGLASEMNAGWLQSALPAQAADFANPMILNNLFWRNEAFEFDPSALPVTPDGPDPLPSAGFFDLEVFGATGPADCFKPRFTALSVPYDSEVTCSRPHASNFVWGAADQPIVLEYTSQFDLGFNSATGEAMVNILSPTGAEPAPPGHDNLPGNYHLCGPTVSPPGANCPGGATITAIDSAPGSYSSPSNPLPTGTVFPAPGPTFASPTIDIDGDARPQNGRGGASTLEWDRGADELVPPGPPGVPDPGE